MLITSKNAFTIIKIIKKMGIKDKVIESFKNISATDKELKKKNKELLLLLIAKDKNYLSLKESEKDKLNIETLQENSELAKDISTLQKRQEDLGLDLITEFILNLDTVENEVYSLIADIEHLTAEEVSEKGVDWLVDKIKEIFASDNIKSLFTFATK